MTKTVLISASMAFDNIMVFPGHFRDHILPDKVHMLNVAFLVPEMRKEYGGCAGNIAYNLKNLGGDPLILATVGQDFSAYQSRLENLAIRTDGILKIEGEFTGQCFITTDKDDNQITAFHPGAMSYSEKNSIPQEEIAIALIGPAGKEGMLSHVDQCYRRGIPCFFDPGQGLPMFNQEELLKLIEQANFLAVNDYEAQLLQDKTGLSLKEIAQHLEVLIVTLGEKGSLVYQGNQEIDIPSVPALEVLDPTGCGDSYRAGLLFGYTQGWSWVKSAKLGSLLGSIKIASQGGQNHHWDQAELMQRFEQVFAESW